jgi:hypothetical protein
VLRDKFTPASIVNDRFREPSYGRVACEAEINQNNWHVLRREAPREGDPVRELVAHVATNSNACGFASERIACLRDCLANTSAVCQIAVGTKAHTDYLATQFASMCLCLDENETFAAVGEVSSRC